MPFLIPAITAVAGFFGIGVSAVVAAQIATSIALTAISVGASLLARMLKGRPRLDALDGPTHTITSEVVNARFLAGKMRTPGVLCYFGAAGREARMGLVLGENRASGRWVSPKSEPASSCSGSDGSFRRSSLEYERGA